MVAEGRARRGEVFLLDLSDARGREMRKSRPCVIVSPDDVSARLGLYVVAPLSTGAHRYAFRVPCRFAGKDGHVVLDQLRSVDESRLLRRLGVLSTPTLTRALATLREMFAD